MCSGRIIHIKAIKTIYFLINEYTKDLVTVDCVP